MTSRRSGRPPERAGGDALAALRLVTAALADRKALDPIVLDLRGLTAPADSFVIVSGTSHAHLRGRALRGFDVAAGGEGGLARGASAGAGGRPPVPHPAPPVPGPEADHLVRLGVGFPADEHH